MLVLERYVVNTSITTIGIGMSNNYHKWKNHFSEMKGDVGMSLHEKEGEQEDA